MSSPPSSWTPDRLAWLALVSFPGFGSRSLEKLASAFQQDSQRALHSSRSALESCSISSKVIDAFFAYRERVHSAEIADRMDREQIRLILRTEPEFPPILHTIRTPPFHLFLRGAMLSSSPLIALVGTRNPTNYGKTVAPRICQDILELGYGVVSGLALGIDGIAHETALAHRGYTLAVLGGGIDDATIYPHSHVSLAHRILAQGGTLATEFPMGTPSLKHHFPLRNRILASLSLATIVVEATERSGSLITAHFALEENREVLAVPGPITHPQSGGTNKLLLHGATPYLGSQTLRDLLSLPHGHPPAQYELSPPEQNLVRHLQEPLQLDDLSRAMHLSIPALRAQLTALELRGVLTLQGGWVSLTGST